MYVKENYSCVANKMQPKPIITSSQQGFVMLAVIWVLLAMLVGVALFSHWVHASLFHAQERQNTINARIAAHTVINTALFVRLTGTRSAYGVSVSSVSSDESLLAMFEVDDLGATIVDHDVAKQSQHFAFDQQVWQYGNLNFVAQDSAGLIGLTLFNHQSMVRNFLRKGSMVREQQLIDSYLDYRDADNQRRFSGAESFDYRLQKRSVPLNGALRTPLQLRDIMHWDQVLRDFSNGDLLYILQVKDGVAVNVNSASAEVLKLVLDDENLANELYEERNKQPFTSVFDINPKINNESVEFQIEPSGGLRFWWWKKNSPSAWVADFYYDSLTPGQAALKRDWTLRVDVPAGLTKQSPKKVMWPQLLEYPDYLDRK